MNTSSIRMLGVALALIAGNSFAGIAGAQEPGALKITNAVFQEVEVKAPDGKVTKRLLPAAKVVPGAEVVYEIAYRNDGRQAATDVAINNPLPRELVFVAAERSPTSVSVDGGETFGQLSELTVTDAEGRTRAAQASDVTDLQWIVANLAPGASGKVVYRALVK